MNEKVREFERLWNSQKDIKRHQFRNRMKSKLEARGIPFSKEKALKLWNGTLVQEDWAKRKRMTDRKGAHSRTRPKSKRRGRKR
ncbi:MAG: hypothetical protein ACE5HJ_02710 [Thermoplasmata archaeon]